MPGDAAHDELDPRWIRDDARNGSAKRHRPNRRSAFAPNWIRACIATALAAVTLAASTAAALACEAESRPPTCKIDTAWLQTDQYMDPWSDLGLSLGASTRDRHAYALNNPISFVDTNGHNCSSGTGTVGGSACADAWENYCEKHPGSDRCPKDQSTGQHVADQMEANDQRVIAATGGGTNYLAPGGPNIADRIVSTPVKMTRQQQWEGFKSFAWGDQVNCVQNPSWGGCAWGIASIWKPLKFGDEFAGGVQDARRGADLLDNAGDAKRATSGVSRMDTFRQMADEGIDGYTVNPHVLNSLRKSGRRHITPDDFRDALGTTPVAGTPGSMIFTNPSTGTQVIVNSDRVIVGVWPKGFR